MGGKPGPKIPGGGRGWSRGGRGSELGTLGRRRQGGLRVLRVLPFAFRRAKARSQGLQPAGLQPLQDSREAAKLRGTSLTAKPTARRVTARDKRVPTIRFMGSLLTFASSAAPAMRLSSRFAWIDCRCGHLLGRQQWPAPPPKRAIPVDRRRIHRLARSKGRTGIHQQLSQLVGLFRGERRGRVKGTACHLTRHLAGRQQPRS